MHVLVPRNYNKDLVFIGHLVKHSYGWVGLLLHFAPKGNLRIDILQSIKYNNAVRSSY